MTAMHELIDDENSKKDTGETGLDSKHVIGGGDVPLFMSNNDKKHRKKNSQQFRDVTNEIRMIFERTAYIMKNKQVSFFCDKKIES